MVGLGVVVPQPVPSRDPGKQADKVVGLSDVQTTLGYLFLGTRSLPCFDAADANDDGRIDLSDPIATLNFLFLGGAALPAPTDRPDLDPTDDRLYCLEGTSG